jgi:hypothetical protein
MERLVISCVQAASLYKAHVAPTLTVTVIVWAVTPFATLAVIFVPLIAAPCGAVTVKTSHSDERRTGIGRVS